MSAVDTLYVKDRREWRQWLQKNHDSKAGIWLVYYKKHTRKASVAYVDAVEEAICFGWIDGQIKKIDEEKHMRRFTPRRGKSLWSEINIERAKKMIAVGGMTEPGLRAFRAGTKNKERVPSSKSFSVPTYLREALAKNDRARINFGKFAPSAKLAYCWWVHTAKTEETRKKRIKKTVQQVAKNKRFGEE